MKIYEVFISVHLSLLTSLCRYNFRCISCGLMGEHFGDQGNLLKALPRLPRGYLIRLWPTFWFWSDSTRMFNLSIWFKWFLRLFLFLFFTMFIYFHLYSVSDWPPHLIGPGLWTSGKWKVGESLCISSSLLWLQFLYSSRLMSVAWETELRSPRWSSSWSSCTLPTTSEKDNTCLTVSYTLSR